MIRNVVFATSAATLLLISTAGAQKPGWIDIHTAGVPAGKHVVVSCIKAGSVFYATETGGGANCHLDGARALPPGSYEVRVEGEGVVTEIKRGILVTPGNGFSVSFTLKEGKGVHIVEYATGPLPREEVTNRLIALEAAVSKLTTTLEARITGTVKKP